MLEKPWVKWIVIGTVLGSSLLVVVFFLMMTYLQKQESEQNRRAQKAVHREYANEFRDVMTRIYKNLQLKHYLAGFRLLESIEEPPQGMTQELREYQEVQLRVAKGLLKDLFYKESEKLFRQLVNTEYNTEARNHLSKIASEYRLNSAQKYLEQAKDFLQEKRWREAESEVRKAKLEFDSVKLFGYHNIDEELEQVGEIRRIAKHHVHLDSARQQIVEAERSLEYKDFEKLRSAMQKAAQHIGRAAFYDQQNPEIDRLRQKLFDLEAEFAYSYPNQIPIWNKDELAARQLKDPYFYLHSYDFDILKNRSDKLRIGFDYSYRLPEDGFYIVRYKIYFSNGSHFFNGHFLSGKDNQEGEIQEVVFEQELPERFQDHSVKRIDLKIYDQQNMPVSKLSRAFRT